MKPARWWREPIFHFVVLGAALWVTDVYLNPVQNSGGVRSAPSETIVVDKARINGLIQNFRNTWGRTPTVQEVKEVVSDTVEDEVMAREGIRMGLDQDDAVIRRRLRQKFELISEEAVAQLVPDAAQLEAFRQSHIDLFRDSGKVAFEQVFFDATRRGDKLAADLLQAKASLETKPSDWRKLGDSIFVLQPAYPLSDKHHLKALFGDEFADALLQKTSADTGRWLGPLPSGYGKHFVRLTSIEPGAVQTLEQARPAVVREWFYAQREKARTSAYQTALARYHVQIDMPVAAPTNNAGAPSSSASTIARP